MLNWEQKLCRGVQLGFERMEHERRIRYRMMAQYVGPLHGKNRMGGGPEEKKASPISLIANGVNTTVPNLVFKDPYVQISTDILLYRDYAMRLELETNYEIVHRMKLRRTARKVVVDSMFGPGIVKVGLANGDQTLDLEGKRFNLGSIYADRVDLDDFVFDPMARDIDEWEWVGNRFRMPKDQAMELYDPELVKKLCSRYRDGNYRDEVSNLWGDGRIVEQYQDIEEYVDLVEVFIPGENLIITIPYGSKQGYGPEKSLRVVEYKGPERGPYHILGYHWIPDNPLPLPPVAHWYWLHVLGNRVARKMARQAERLKRVLAYTSPAVADAKEVVDAEDGATIEVEDVNNLKEVTYGGMTEEAAEFLAWVESEFSKQAGNIDILGGLKDDSPTATQSQQLNNNASIKVTDMQEQVYHFMAEVCRDIVFFIHGDPLREHMNIQRAGGVESEILYSPEFRKGTFLDYTTKIKPYSMAPQEPNLKLKRFMEFISQGIPALTQAAMQLGPAFKLDRALALVGRLMSIDELDELIDMPVLIQQMMLKVQLAGAPDGGAPGSQSQMESRPQQPNPRGTGPVGGTPPSTEQKQGEQEVSAESQSTYTA
jgi:hypothetical protein